MEYIIDFSSRRPIMTSLLQKMHKNAFAATVRETLNDIAFDMKMNTLIPAAKKEFDYTRNKTFIKAITGAKKAKGLNVNSMYSAAGIPTNIGGERDKAADRMENQATATPLQHTYTPLNAARAGGSRANRVSVRLKNTSYVNANKDGMATGMKQRMMFGALKGKKMVKVNGKNGKNFIAKPMKYSMKQRKADGLNSHWIKLKFLYVENDARTAMLRTPRPFAVTAKDETMKKVDKLFAKNFKKRYLKHR